jgi:hypothetical protein
MKSMYAKIRMAIRVSRTSHSNINIHIHTNLERNVLESRAFFRCRCPSSADFSEYREEEEVLVAAATGFDAESVDWISVPNRATSASGSFEIPRVKLADLSAPSRPQTANEAIFPGISKNISNETSRCRITNGVNLAIIHRRAHPPADRPMCQPQSPQNPSSRAMASLILSFAFFI